MRSKRLCVYSLVLATCLTAAAQRPDYPPARTEIVIDELHGVSIADPYRWLEDWQSDEVQTWIGQQNALTRQSLDQFPEQRQKLVDRLMELHAVSTVSSPRIYGARYFTTRRDAGQNHAVVYVRDGGMDAEAKAVLNPNEFSADQTVALDWWFPSPDGAFIAYGKSPSGNERSTLYVRHVATGKDLPLEIPHTRSCTVAWDPDGKGFLYMRYPEPGSVPEEDEVYFRHLFYHKLGTDPKDDAKLYGEGRPKTEWPNVSSSSDYRHQFLIAKRGWSEQDLLVRKSGESEFRPVAVGLNALHEADSLGDTLFIRTNHEAPRYRVVTADASTPTPENWKELIPEQTGVIEDVALIGGKLIVTLMENAYSRLVVYEADGKLVSEIALPTLGSVSGVRGKHDGDSVYFQFESFAYPPAVFRYDLGAHELAMVEQVKTNLDLAQFETEQIWCESKDGTRVPIFLVHKPGLTLEGDNPTVLYGYGGFNISITPSFIQHAIPFIEAGGIYALANLRGGGEFGEDWHKAGQLANKQNVFDDMIAACEKLIADKYTRAERLGLRGGSNGGLLIGAMLVQRPDLFNASLCAVPLLDMLRYHQFSIARLWIPEYGSAEDPEQFKYIHAYSPYQHVKQGAAYPAVLFTTAESDSRVDPMHALKMTALMQSATSSDNPILLHVEKKAGHGKGKPLKMQVEERADAWLFFMWRLGMLGDGGES